MHYKKDGTLDMRYKSSKDFVASGGSSYMPPSFDSGFSPFFSSPSPSPAPAPYVPSYPRDLHMKRDGTPDMRYRSSKQYFQESSTPSYASPSPSQSDYHYKKDGTLDRRYRSTKEYEQKNSTPSYQAPSQSDYHYKKDGTLDRRYRSTKEYEQNEKKNDLHRKNDGTLDMRYRTSKDHVADHPEDAPPPRKPKTCIAPPSYDHNLKVRKDGFLNMTTKANKEYAALPRDRFGDVIQSSAEANEFRRAHDISRPPPTTGFNFSYTNPVYYNGFNSFILDVFEKAFRCGTKKLGILILFHATSEEIARKIMEEHSFKPGSKGMFGAGMYFADNRKAAMHKTAHGKDAIVVAVVAMDIALVVEGPKYDLNESQINELGCNSVLGRSSPAAEWEYVVYDPKRVYPIAMEVIRSPNGYNQ